MTEMLLLRPPAWADDFSSSSSSSSTPAASTSSSPPSSASASCSTSLPSSSPVVSGLVSYLIDRRLYREVTFSLRTLLADAIAPFSFLRVNALRLLLKHLSLTSESETLIRLFRQSQRDSSLQVVPVLFKHSLASSKELQTCPDDPISCVEPPMAITGPTNHEVALALRVLEGCCLLDKGNRILASKYMATKVMLDLLSAGGSVEQDACLDALPSLLLDTRANQQDFAQHGGLAKVASLVKNREINDTTRLKSADFLLLLVGSLLPRNVGKIEEGCLCVEHAQLKLCEIFGVDIIPIFETADEILTSCDSGTTQRETALHAHARSLVELFDLVDDGYRLAE